MEKGGGGAHRPLLALNFAHYSQIGCVSGQGASHSEAGTPTAAPITASGVGNY